MLSEEKFINSLSSDQLPSFCSVSPLLKALWYLMRGEWEDAHVIVQDDESKIASWMHALIHKVEGDIRNAKYWYDMAGIPVNEQKNIDRECLQVLKVMLKKLESQITQ